MIGINFLQNFNAFVSNGSTLLLHTEVILSDPVFVSDYTAFNRDLEYVFLGEDLQLG